MSERTAWGIVRTHLLAYWLTQLGVWALMLAAILLQPQSVLLYFWINAALPVLYSWAAYRGCKALYSGQPPDDVRDFCVPFFVVGAVCVCGYYVCKLLLARPLVG